MRKLFGIIALCMLGLIVVILSLPKGSLKSTASSIKQSELVKHTKFSESLAPRVGKRVQINARERISQSECRKLILHYRSEAMPDGQTSVHMPSNLLEGRLTPFCVDNIDGQGIQFNTQMFEQLNKKYDLIKQKSKT